MKKMLPLFVSALLFAGAFVASTSLTTAQLLSTDDVPSDVISAFERAHPHAAVKSYSKEERDGVTVYEIESIEGKKQRDFVYSADGTLLDTEERIPPARLPDPVKRALSRDYPDHRIISAERHTGADSVDYGVVLRKGKRRIEVRFDKSGNVRGVTRPQ